MILTGAGFTANWGGKVASQLRYEIFNHRDIRSRERLFAAIQNEASFEDALASGYSQQYTADESQAVEQAIFDVFKMMDDKIESHRRSVNIETNTLLKLLFCQAMVKAGSKCDKQSFVFTLNQDIFMERSLHQSNVQTSWSRYPIEMPAVPNCRLTHWQDRSTNCGYFNPCGSGLPSYDAQIEGHPEPLRSDIPDDFQKALPYNCYIKLHGSYNWRRKDGHGEMVIGTDKTIQIYNSPLLRWYSEVYKRALTHTNLRLLVIGYGFGDKHINETIFNAVTIHGASLYIWNTACDQIESHLKFHGAPLPGITTKHQSLAVLSAARFYPQTMADMIPLSGSRADFDRLLKDYFD